MEEINDKCINCNVENCTGKNCPYDLNKDNYIVEDNGVIVGGGSIAMAEEINAQNSAMIMKKYLSVNGVTNDYDIQDLIFYYEEDEFHKYLTECKELSLNTINLYERQCRKYFSVYNELTKRNLQEYKMNMIDNDTPAKTINSILIAVSKYIDFLENKYRNPLIKKLRVKTVKVQQKSFLENVISFEDYQYLTASLFKDNNLELYYIVRLMACTGMRLNEFVQIRAEHIKVGYFDVYGKKKKQRRIFIPKTLREEMLKWIEENNINGLICTNKRTGEQLTGRGLAYKLKESAIKYNINPDVVYPHSFRHMFAKKFLSKRQDIALLADLLGHDSIETTRIYLRMTAEEQRMIIDDIVDW